MPRKNVVLLLLVFLAGLAASSGPTAFSAVKITRRYVDVSCNPATRRADTANQPPRLAIVIDDLAAGPGGLERMLGLGLPLTFAVLPSRPETRELVERVTAAGHEVILHMPMEARRAKPHWYVGTPLLTNMSDSEITAAVLRALHEVPEAKGVNNHMGSVATESRRLVSLYLAALKAEGRYVLDSRTSYRSVIPKVAAELGVPCLQRTVFLDNVPDRAAVAEQLRLLGKLAQERGTAIGIGHVGRDGAVTAAAMAEVLPELQKQGIQLVLLSDLLK